MFGFVLCLVSCVLCLAREGSGGFTLKRSQRQTAGAEPCLHCPRAHVPEDVEVVEAALPLPPFPPGELLFEQASTATTKREFGRRSNGKASCGSLRCTLPIPLCDESVCTCRIGLLPQLNSGE
jgi:hypothetical protein